MMHVFLAGVNLDDNGFALDGFREVGPGNHFFGCAHTMANYETAFYTPELADNDSFEQWRDAGGHDAEARAHQRCKQVLATVEPPPLDEGIDEALREFIARKKSAMPDSWY
jgi:trimethylamine--corrinoid protein Co-methyltransferase